MIDIIKATPEHIPQLAILFDKYRIFYKQESDILGATLFLKERFSKNESVVLLALYNNVPVGFTQLYTSFSSVQMQAVYILNDLFVAEKFRKKGLGEALLNEAKSVCLRVGYKGLALETGIDNPAQHLYERLGWKKDADCFHYFWTA